MALTSLLVLVAAVGVGPTTDGPLVASTPGVQPETSLPAQPFKVEPLQLGRPGLVGSREYFGAKKLGAEAWRRVGVVEPVGRANVVCPMPVVKADPGLDAGIVRIIPADRFDRIARDDVAGCRP
jgi:hypothetical protein